jgi:hypothetical protein
MCLNETCRKVLIGKHLSDSFSIQNGLKQRSALSPLFFNFVFLCAIRKILENQVSLSLIGTHQLLAYTADMNLLGDDMDTTNINTKTSFHASTKVGQIINVEKSKHILLSRHQSADQIRDIKIGNRP